MTDSHLSADREWPHWPNFDQFKHQAKDLLKSYRAGDADAVAQVNRHEQAPDPAVFALHDAQRVLARSYGLPQRLLSLSLSSLCGRVNVQLAACERDGAPLPPQQ